MTVDDIIKLMQAIAPAVAVYASVRADLAAMGARMTNVERIVYREAK